MKIRLEGTPGECEAAVARIQRALTVVDVSDPYPNRGRSALVRVYLDVRIPQDSGTAGRVVPELGERES